VVATIVGVYRRRNADRVAALVEPALAQGWRVAWWALEGADPLLAEVTVGEGPGLKLPLLNETLRRLAAPTDWTVVSDDDLGFRRGDVVRFARLCERAGFDLAQPARARGTELSHGITVAPRLSRARRTTFVESGPLFAVGPRFRDRILPLPEQRGMGWGVEIDWHDLAAEGCRLGIVDSVTIEHRGRAGAAYDAAELKRRLRAELEARGQPEWGDMRRTLAVWELWQRRPPWLRGPVLPVGGGSPPR
jgi:hypothetical protein